MRMWLVDPAKMCRQHLLGEHLEMHMFATNIKDGKSIEGYARNGVLDTSKIKSRHDELVAEMKRRGFNHRTPLRYKDELGIGYVDSKASLRELRKRCAECRKLQRSPLA